MNCYCKSGDSSYPGTINVDSERLDGVLANDRIKLEIELARFRRSKASNRQEEAKKQKKAD